MSWKFHLAALANRFLRRFDARLVSTAEARQYEIWRPLSQLGKQPTPEGRTDPFSPPFLKGFRGSEIASLQKPFNFAVIIPTVLRPKIVDSIQSVFGQRFPGTVQVLIGIDAASGDLSHVEQVCGSIPDRQSVLLFYPGYSTSRRHGGLDASWDGGALRTVLSYLANSRYVAYLDDDNWWSDDHLSTMHAVLSGGAEWVYALRWFVHPGSRQPICKDEWESVGPGKGFFSQQGGWVDPNCLAIDKIACEAVLRWWSIPLNDCVTARTADRTIFRFLSTKFRGAPTGRYSVFYEIAETDLMHPYRLRVIGEQEYQAAGKRPNRSDRSYASA